ncbi:MAG: FlgD immunoglobulin-like domain containing protein [Candidatus Eisenbacteria bacterium]
MLTCAGPYDIFLVKFGTPLAQPMVAPGGYQTVEYAPPVWEIEVELINSGPGSANMVSAHMSEDLTWLRITDSNCSYGNIPEGGSSWGMSGDSYTLRFLDGYPGGEFDVHLDVTYEDALGTPYVLQFDLALDPATTGVTSGEDVVPAFRLLPNRPNPFNPETRISFDMPRSGNADLVIYNTAGRVVRTLWSGELPAGHHSVVWTGASDNGRPVPSGTYFYRLRTGPFSQTNRMVLLR